MKAKKSSADKNKLTTRYGTARFYAPLRAKSEWDDPATPKYKPNWLVRFRVGGETWEESAGPLYPVLDGLQRGTGVMEWAETRMRTHMEAMRKGQLEEMESVVRGARAVMLDELGRAYLANVPPGKADYLKNWQRMVSLCTEITGLAKEEIEVTDAVLSRARLLGWVRMRQEHFRRGWSAKKAAPTDAWTQLRRDLSTGKLPEDTKWPKMEGNDKMLKVLAKGELPGVDKETVMECNTTIRTYLRCAKAVFANQREYLVGLELPALAEFLSFAVDLAVPEGHREIDGVAEVKLMADAERLRREEPKLWAWDVIVSWTGARPITIKALAGSALTVLPVGTGVITLPAAKGGLPVRVPVDIEAVEALLAVRTEGSLLGAKHKTEANDIHRAYNAWLTKHGVTGTLKSYLKRHMRLDQYREEGGLELSAAGGGHTTTAMAERKYTKNRKVIPMLPPLRGKVIEGGTHEYFQQPAG